MRGFFWFGIRLLAILRPAEGSQEPLVRSLVAALCRDAIYTYISAYSYATAAIYRGHLADLAEAQNI